jgi:hypothetical protein
MRHAAAVSLALLAFALCGCPANRQPATFQSESESHSHERGNMLLTDATPYCHAALTAHLSEKDGNELHAFFETVSDPPKPVRLSLISFKAFARTADGTEREVEFDPAPKDQRKDDPDGSCSHFVAKAPWMKPEDVLLIRGAAMVQAKLVPITWKDFSVKKYSQHVE